jgi:hypothetical protein
MGYEIEGYFGTLKSSRYLNDVIARFLITFQELQPQRLPYKPHVKPDIGHYYAKIYKLKELQNLKSLKNKAKAPARADSFDDYMFWAIKLFCEDLIRANGLATYQQLEDFAYINFEQKERSTLRAKCRSIFNWYEQRDWELKERIKKDKGEIMATRQEHAKTMAQQKAEKAKRKVINAITGLMAETYKKKNGKWNAKAIALDLQISQPTVAKYLREHEASNHADN